MQRLVAALAPEVATPYRLVPLTHHQHAGAKDRKDTISLQLPGSEAKGSIPRTWIPGYSPMDVVIM